MYNILHYIQLFDSEYIGCLKKCMTASVVYAVVVCLSTCATVDYKKISSQHAVN